MAAKLLTLETTITCHAWNKDCTRLALCPNDNTVEIYAKNGNNFVLETTLDEHTQTVMGIDWAPNSNLLLTASQDRNAYVWSEEKKTWKPMLVILRINRAATTCRWCPNESKFAVASGSKSVSICYYEAEPNWYISKHIKKNLKSTVTSLDWAHDNALIVVGATDFKARIYCAAVRGVDSKPQDTAWGGKMQFGECLAEFDFGTSWIHGVSFSPNGEKVAFVSHDSSVVIVEANGNLSHMRLSCLPYKSIMFLTDNTLIAGGFDANLTSFTCSGGVWSLQAQLDDGKKGPAAKAGGNSNAAFAKFAAADKLGTSAPTDTSLKTTHQNTITEIRAMGSTGNVSTVGADGLLVQWPLNQLQSSVQGFKIN